MNHVLQELDELTNLTLEPGARIARRSILNRALVKGERPDARCVGEIDNPVVSR